MVSGSEVVAVWLRAGVGGCQRMVGGGDGCLV